MYRLREYYGSRDYTFVQPQQLKSTFLNVGESDLKFVKRLAAVAKMYDYSTDKPVEIVSDVVVHQKLAKQHERPFGREAHLKIW